MQGSFNIGILHTGLGGMGGHANYAPCSLNDLVNKGYDYWALAHVHQSSILHERPHIVFCGNLQGRQIRECGAKSAFLVTVEDGQVAELTAVEADVVRWMHICVAADGIEHPADVVNKISHAIEGAVANASSGRLIACRIELTGQTRLHDYLLCARDQLAAEARAAALALGDEAAWVERLVLATEPLPSASMTAGAPDELSGIIGEAARDDGLRAQLEADIGELIRKLPYDIRSDAQDGVLKAAISGDYAEITNLASRYLAAWLSAGGP